MCSLTVCNRLQEIRSQKEESRAQLAKAIGVSRQTITNLETCGGNPTAEIMFKIAKHYGVSLSNIFYLEEECAK